METCNNISFNINNCFSFFLFCQQYLKLIFIVPIDLTEGEITESIMILANVSNDILKNQ
jgi:hypothetical protein